ncbi:hypothetical protein JCM33374_g4132 [Metschnikowia sp. JCM 33374]|nr:hypothetical protein JCM33374_g4132 [Metschnikowia sp. JCM 33374]
MSDTSSVEHVLTEDPMEPFRSYCFQRKSWLDVGPSRTYQFKTAPVAPQHVLSPNCRAGWLPGFFKSDYRTNLLHTIDSVTDINFSFSAPAYELIEGDIYGYHTTISNYAIEENDIPAQS